MEALRIAILDDHQILVEGMIELLRNRPLFKYVKGFSSFKELLKFEELSLLDMLLLDITLDEQMEGINRCRELKEAYPQLKIIAFSSWTKPLVIEEMKLAGADGYLLKNTSSQEVEDACLSVLKGKKYWSPEITVIMDDHKSQMENTQSSLTRREMEVLRLIAKAKSTKEIAEELFVSLKTVETHRMHLMKKLEASNSIALVNIAQSLGLV